MNDRDRQDEMRRAAIAHLRANKLLGTRECGLTFRIGEHLYLVVAYPGEAHEALGDHYTLDESGRYKSYLLEELERLKTRDVEPLGEEEVCHLIDLVSRTNDVIAHARVRIEREPAKADAHVIEGARVVIVYVPYDDGEAWRAPGWCPGDDADD